MTSAAPGLDAIPVGTNYIGGEGGKRRVAMERRDGVRSAISGNQQRPGALPGRGGLVRIARSALNSLRGLREGLQTEAAVKQEVALAILAVPLSFLVATNVWIWLALLSSVLFVLAIEFLNTAVERLCNHVTPEHHEAIRVTKDLASTAVFFALLLAGLVWLVAFLDRVDLIGCSEPLFDCGL